MNAEGSKILLRCQLKFQTKFAYIRGGQVEFIFKLEVSESQK